MPTAATDPLTLLDSIAESVPADVLANTPQEVRERLSILGHATASLIRMLAEKSGQGTSSKLADTLDSWADDHVTSL